MPLPPDTVDEQHAPAPCECPGEMRSVTRQPILSRSGRVHGYEILFDPAAGDDIEAARTLLDNLVLFGFERLARGLPIFIRCSREALISHLVEVLPPQMTVIEVPQSLETSPRLVEACRGLRLKGFRVALVDCTQDPQDHPLFDLLDYIKVDIAQVNADILEILRQRIKANFAVLIAENVHSQESFHQAADAGFNYFQGFYFCHPEPIHNAKVPANRVVHIEILRQLFRDPLELKLLCPLVMRDAALVYRLLRLVNSPICAIRREVDSVQAAIMILGDNTFRRIATLAIQCELNAEQPPEIVHMALIRARFCELAAPLARLDANEQYLLGMMSMLPAMLHVPMTALAADLPLRAAAVEALLGAAIPERRLLDWIEALERRNFAESRCIADICKLDHEKLNRCYLEATAWETQEQGLLD
jgi:EAL and modified HD-GYP domain-containing signal transduction protein